MNSPTTSVTKKPRWGLKGKLILSMLLVGVVPLVVGLVMAFYVGYEEIRMVSGTNFAAIATETARKLDLVLSDEVSRTRRITRDPRIIKALERRRDQSLPVDDRLALEASMAKAWRQGDSELVKAITQSELGDLLRRYYTGPTTESEQRIPVVTRSAKRALFITDINGTLVASINADASFANAQEEWFQGAFNRGVGQAYITNVAFDDRFQVFAFSLSLPIMDSIRYQAVGVLHQVYDAKEFLAPSVHPIRFGKTGHVMLIDTAGTIITCPILPTGTRLADERLIELVTPAQPGWVAAPTSGHGDETDSFIAALAGSIIGYARLPETSRITQSSTNRAWHTFVWESSDELFAPVQHLLTWISVFGFVAIGLLVTLGYMAAGRIVTPVRRLQEAALLIGRGELKERIHIKTGDEIEDLAEEINRMSAQLEVAFAGLTDQVEQKTQEVQYLQKVTDQILDSMVTPIFLLGPGAHVEYINRAAEEAFCLEGQEGEGSNLFELLPLDDASRARLDVELEALTAPGGNGKRELLEDEASRVKANLRDPLKPQLVSGPAQARKEIQIGPCIYNYEWFQITARGGSPRIGLILRNVTDESRRQDQLIQAEKLGSMGVLAAGIGHELNNPLFGILGLGEAIQDETDIGKIKSYAKDIVQHGKRMAGTIRDFTGMARSDAKERSSNVDINDQLSQALRLVPHEGDKDDVQIETSYQPLQSITAVPEELRQVFVNVIANAVQAMKNKGKLTVSTQIQNGIMEIRIQDTGPGIPKAFLSKVFDPFFTTKGQGEGSGLGLTVANRLVTKYGGRIQLSSEEGQGTTCLITFPLPEYTQTGERPS